MIQMRAIPKEIAYVSAIVRTYLGDRSVTITTVDALLTFIRQLFGYKIRALYPSHRF